MTGNSATGRVYAFLQNHPRLKHLARTTLMTALKFAPPAWAYKVRSRIERFVFRAVDSVAELPPAFHYWSHTWLRPILQAHGYNSPDDFFLQEVVAKATTGPLRILSIACGRAELEIALARHLHQHMLTDFSIHCADLNGEMLDAAMARIAEAGLEGHFSCEVCDLNVETFPAETFDVIIANQCLHHLSALEHVMAQLAGALKAGGVLLVSDVIGRNGHQLWPEALREMQAYWRQLPRRLRRDRALGGAPRAYVNYDHSAGGFEGIRAQDVLPCLLEEFEVATCITFGCLTIPVVDRRFGWNYDIDDAQDRRRIDGLAERENSLLATGELKPTQLLGKFIPRKPGQRDRNAQTRQVLRTVLRSPV